MLGRIEAGAYEIRQRVGGMRPDAPDDLGQHIRNLGATIHDQMDDLPRADVKAAMQDVANDNLYPGVDQDAIKTRAHARLLALYEWSYDQFGTGWEVFKAAVTFVAVFIFSFSVTFVLTPILASVVENFMRGFSRGYGGPSLGEILSGNVDVGSSSRFRVDDVSGDAITEEEKRLAQQSSSAYQLGDEDIELIGRYEDVYIGKEGIGTINAPSVWSPDPDTDVELTKPTLDRVFRQQNPTDAELHEREMEDLYDDLDDFEEFHN